MSDHPIKTAVDVGAGVTAIATIANWLPSIAAIFTIVWYGLRIWETDTVKSLLGRK